MKYDVTFTDSEVRVTLTESLELPEGQKPLLGGLDGRRRFDLLQQIQALVRELLNGFADDHGGPPTQLRGESSP
jgi:hypothetical protein